jgi:peptidoglycan/xylan/chitin deacetylase (PgdA/CDA1 family)
MVSARIPNLIKKIYCSLIWDLNNGKRELYVTFDDGPTPSVTPRVLDILDSYNAKATFFCIGRNVDRFPRIYNQILKRGHAVGNHTYSHLKGWKINNREYFKDIELAGSLIKSNLFRPPYGKIKRSQFKYLRYHYNIIMWDVMSMDFNKKSNNEKCLSNVIKNVRPGSIIVFHDSIKASQKLYYTLPKMLDILCKKNYSFNKINNFKVKESIIS